MRLLLLDGTPARRRALARRLRADGHAVDEVRTLRAAREALADVDYDGLVVSRRVVDGDALAQVADLRSAGSALPIVVVAGPADPAARVEALAAGADDVVPGELPAPTEVVLRVRKVLLRAGRARADAPAEHRLGRVLLVPSRREVLVDGERCALSATQYCLLEALLAAGGRPVPSGTLLARCWDRNRVGGNPLPAQLSRLRRALGGALAIEWVRGAGHVARVP